MVYQELQARGLIHDETANLKAVLDQQKPPFYVGVDPTSDSLHVGHLLVYVTARRLVEGGLKPILIVGGGTGRIGDPKPDAERPLLSEEEIEHNVKALTRQVQQLLGTEVTVINNYDWLGQYGLIDFLRDIGKHFTVNALLKKDAIAARLSSDVGLSYTEFAYPLLQATDYLELYRRVGCRLQIGGSDQWGNIVAGVDLIRRLEGEEVAAFTVPLLTDPQTGKKFGKSEGNAIWLDPEKTSPFQFYQFFINTTDELAEVLLYKLTFIPLEEIKQIIAEAQKQPKERIMQKAVAAAVTDIVHGETMRKLLQQASEVLFGENPKEVLAQADPHLKDILIKEVSSLSADQAPEDVPTLLVSLGLARSKNEARDLISQGGVRIFDRVLTPGDSITPEDWAQDLLLIRRGKRQVALLYR